MIPAPREPAFREIELPERFNLTTALLDDRVAGGDADRPALHHDGTLTTYRQLLARVCRAARGLDALGVRPEERVAVLLHDRPEFLDAFLGAIRIGAVAVPLNTGLTVDDHLHQVDDCRARVLVTERPLADALLARRAELPFLRHVVTTDEWFDGDDAALPPAPTPRDEAAFWLFSSGSTGRPKGIVHAHKDVLHVAEYFGRETLGLTRDDVIFSVPRLYFAYGLGNSLYIPLALGASAVLVPDRPTPDTVERYRPSVFFGVPTSYAQYLAHAERTGESGDWSSVRLCHSGGEPLPTTVFERWRDRLGLSVLDGLGSSEGSHIFVSNTPTAIRPGSSGRVVPGFDARIVREDGTRAGPDEIGMLEMSGASFAARYWNNEATTRDTFQGRWNRTGDWYRRDPDGYFWFQGRADDMLKSGGVWVSPIEVEELLLRSGELTEAAVVGVEDDDGLSKPVAFVVPRPGVAAGPDLAERLRTGVRAAAAPWKTPHRIEFVDELPKTASGKVRRFKLKERTV